MALEYRLGHWFPYRNNATYPTYESLVGTEPSDSWDSVRIGANTMADFQWRTKTLQLSYVGTYDIGSGPTVITDTIAVSVGREGYTTFEELWADFVVGGDHNIATHIEVAVTDGTISTTLFFSLGSIWTVGTETDTPFRHSESAISHYIPWSSFVIPASVQLGSSGGDTINPDYPDTGGALFGGVVGRCNYPGGSFNIFRERSNRTVFFDSLDVNVSVNSYLTLPTPA